MNKREIKDIKYDFKYLKDNKDLVYLNSSSTSLKPDIFVKKLSDIYSNHVTSFGKSAHSKDLDIMSIYIYSLNKIARHINSEYENILPTYGTTDFINKVARKIITSLNNGDEIILGKFEHAANILPWVNICKEQGKNIIFKWYKIKDWKIDFDHLKSLVTDKTKVLSIAHVFNTSGSINDISMVRKAIGKDVILVVDGAQAIGHIPINVKDGDTDYYIFSAHKAFGQHGLGFSYVKNLESIEEPWTYGGGNNLDYSETTVEYKKGKNKYIVGTRDVPGVIAFGTCIDYIESFGIENIYDYNKSLKKYAEKRLLTLSNVKILNPGVDSSNIFFEIDGVAGEDVGYHLSMNGIILRTGTNCVKIKNNLYEQYKSIRASFHIYNTFEDVDKLYEAIKSGGDFLESLFGKKPPTDICS